MNRHELDTLIAPHSLSTPMIERALLLTDNRPSAAAWRLFAVRGLGLAGMAAVGAGLIFFVAANWQSMSVIERFALVQILLLLALGVAWWKARSNFTPNQGIFPGALILATLVSGALLALFGQTYQTGADVHELFFIWALLALPFALAAMSGALWAVWACILNIGLVLYTGMHGPGDFVWALFDRWGINKPAMLMLPFIVNLAGAVLAHFARTTRYAKAAPHWLSRLLLSFAFAYGIMACMLVIQPQFNWDRIGIMTAQNYGVFAVFALICAAIAYYTLRQKRDVYPLALIAASFLVLSTTYIMVHFLPRDIGGLFLLAMWLIAASTTLGFVLMHYVKAWRGNSVVST